MVKIKNIYKQLLYFIFGLFIIYLIYELTRKILGGSLGFEELIIGLLVTILGYLFHIQNSINKLDVKISGHIGWHKGKDED